MAFYDWNKDGNNDVRDDFIEYNIYKKSTSDSNYSSGNSGCGALGWAAVILILLGILFKCGG